MPEGRVVVFDTNVLIPLILPASQSTGLLLRLARAGWDVAASPQIIRETAGKLRTKDSLRKWLGNRRPDTPRTPEIPQFPGVNRAREDDKGAIICLRMLMTSTRTAGNGPKPAFFSAPADLSRRI